MLIHTSKSLITALAIAAILPSKADVILLEPTDGARFQTLTDWQLKTFAGATKMERYAILKDADKQKTQDEWRRQRPLRLKWKSTDGDKYPWRVRLAMKRDFSDARDFWLMEHRDKDGDVIQRTKSADGKETTWIFTVPLANLELGKTYYWEVWSRVKCPKYGCGFTYPDKCKCGMTKHGRKSKVFSFTTEADPPRWIALEGRTKNIRDIGGWTGEGGRKVRMGMAYRGQAFNDNSLAGVGLGRNRLMFEDAKYLIGTLGIKMDLDLRNDREIPGLTESPLGSSVRFVHISSDNYADLFSDWALKAMAKNFRLFCDKKNYPIYFHCIAGADRTGTLAYVLHGILGVSREDIGRDWESTFYPEIPGVKNPDTWRTLAHLDRAFAKYGKPEDTLQRKLELFLQSLGITQKEITTFKSIMLEE